MKRKMTKAFIYVAGFVFFIISIPASAHHDTYYVFEQTIFNNAPWLVSLTETGCLRNGIYDNAFIPPNEVQFEKTFVVKVIQGFSLTGMSYKISNPGTPYYNQGCKIVSLSVNGFHEVTEVVQPITNPSVISCSCTATEGERPTAVLVFTYEPTGASTSPVTCHSTS
jgi:hypothetical protein